MAEIGTTILEDDASLPGVHPDESFYTAFNLLSKIAYGNAINAVLQLRIPNILAKAEREGKSALSVEEILEQLPTKSKPGLKSSSNLTRLLRPALQDGLLKESLDDQKQSAYSLTDISRWFVKDKARNLLDIAGLMLSPPIQCGSHHFSDLILDETIDPFNEGNKRSFFQLAEEDANFRDLVHQAMAGWSNVEFAALLDGLRQCGALEGAKTFVDVGGGIGTAVAEIVARNPNVHGINFDRPEIIAISPKSKGVEHVAGNFLESIPSGNVMFLKHILHDHGDEDAICILRNCFEALPKRGQVIIAEIVLRDWRLQDTDPKARLSNDMDMTMLLVFNGGQERTEAEYKRLLEKSGFSRVNIIELHGCLDLVLASKE